MTVEILRRVKCDGCGRSLDIHATADRRARTAAKTWGMRYVDGRDLCGRCEG